MNALMQHPPQIFIALQACVTALAMLGLGLEGMEADFAKAPGRGW